MLVPFRVHTWPTPNGHTAGLLLERLAPFAVHLVAKSPSKSEAR